MYFVFLFLPLMSACSLLMAVAASRVNMRIFFLLLHQIRHCRHATHILHIHLLNKSMCISQLPQLDRYQFAYALSEQRVNLLVAPQTLDLSCITVDVRQSVSASSSNANNGESSQRSNDEMTPSLEIIHRKNYSRMQWSMGTTTLWIDQQRLYIWHSHMIIITVHLLWWQKNGLCSNTSFRCRHRSLVHIYAVRNIQFQSDGGGCGHCFSD